MSKTALITGITGQDGSYLAELLLDKGYLVHGIRRRASTDNTNNIEQILGNNRLVLHYADLTDTSSLFNVVKNCRPDEIYNLGAQSDVRTSFDIPILTYDINATGTLRLLEVIKQLDMLETTKFYQASTSELYGLTTGIKSQNENTPFHPRSPYGVSKLSAYWALQNYREAYNLFACNGILFNHESPRRGENFITRKITSKVAMISKGLLDTIEVGNLEAIRDWGHAKDYVQGMWNMLQSDLPGDYVLATNKTNTVRELIEICFEHINMPIRWEGSGLKEVGLDAYNKIVVKINSKYYRPTEVSFLRGDYSKAYNLLNWSPSISFKELIIEMLESDINNES